MVNNLLFNIDDIWADSLKVIVEGATAKDQLTVIINGEEFAGKYMEEKAGNPIWMIEYDFSSKLVGSIEVKLNGKTCSDGTNGALKAMLHHDTAAIKSNVQKRGAMEFGNRVQLIASFQSYLWARANRENPCFTTRENWIMACSTSICSIAYRYIQNIKRVKHQHISQLRIMAKEITDIIDNSTNEARWYPSVQLALGQLCLTALMVDKAVEYFSDISDKQESILKSEPICAFNISMANCLLTYILEMTGDPRLKTYCNRWEYVFRNYPPTMDIRFGTMEEFGKIYRAVFANYKLMLEREKCKDKRFTPVSFEEVMESCMRVKVSAPQIRSVKEALLSYRQQPGSLKDKLLGLIGL